MKNGLKASLFIVLTLLIVGQVAVAQGAIPSLAEPVVRVEDFSLFSPLPAANQRFGYSYEGLASSGNTIIVGSQNERAVHVYESSGINDISHITKLRSPTPHNSFAWAADIDENWIAVSAPAQPVTYNGQEINSGRVYMYLKTTDGWQYHSTVSPSDPGEYDYFGMSVAVSGTTVVVGAAYETHTDGGREIQQAGAVYIYELDGNEWVEVKKVIDTQSYFVGSWFGHSVAIQGDTIVIGYPQGMYSGTENDIPPLHPPLRGGMAYVYSRSDGNWNFVQKLLMQEYCEFAFRARMGWGVDIDGDVIAVGAYGDDAPTRISNGPGAVYVFRKNGEDWGFEQKLVSNLRQNKSQFGIVVDVSDEMVLVGSPSYDYPGDNGGYNGEGYIFKYNSGTWHLLEVLRDNNPVIGRQLGRHIAFENGLALLSSEFKTYIADGAILPQAGAVNFYDYSQYFNQPPIANVGLTASVYEGSAAPLTAIGSDPDGDPLTYAWDTDGDGAFETPSQTLDFSAAALDGPDIVLLDFQVCDDKGFCDTAEFTIEILNANPVVDAGDDQVVLVNTPVHFDGSFTDSGLDDTHTIFWDFGEGQSSTVLFSATNIYHLPGFYTATLTITDDDGGVGVDSLVITVLSQQEASGEIIVVIENLVSEDVLGEGPANALISKLEAVINSLDKGKTKPAINQLESFTNQIEAMIQAEQMEPDLGLSLIETIESILASLE